MERGVLFRVCLLFVSTAVSLFVGFKAFDSTQAVSFVKNVGYWLIFANFVCLAWNLFGRLRSHFESLENVRSFLLVCKVPALFIGAMSVVLVMIQPTGYKVTMDEPVMASTSMRMHEYKEVMTTVRAYELQGAYTQLDGYVDKRPYFYPFLVSLLHDISGYRSSNAFVLNIILTPVFTRAFVCFWELDLSQFRGIFGLYTFFLRFPCLP